MQKYMRKGINSRSKFYKKSIKEVLYKQIRFVYAELFLFYASSVEITKVFLLGLRS